MRATLAGYWAVAALGLATYYYWYAPMKHIPNSSSEEGAWSSCPVAIAVGCTEVSRSSTSVREGPSSATTEPHGRRRHPAAAPGAQAWPRKRRLKPCAAGAMGYRWLADATVALHLAFILFVVLGGFLAWRDLRWAWLHLPAVAWVAWLEFTGAICP